jgi:hypothetical protein
MDQAKPRRRPRKKPTPPPEVITETHEVEHPPEEKPVLQVTEAKENKYAPKPKVGTPKLGRSPNYVETVGLGKLKVITANGNTDV